MGLGFYPNDLILIDHLQRPHFQIQSHTWGGGGGVMKVKVTQLCLTL